MQELLKRLPSVDAMLQAEPVRNALTCAPRKLVLESIRDVLDAKRNRLRESPETATEADFDPIHLAESVLERLEEKSRYGLRPTINATGVVIHTNLGRSLLPEEALERIRLISGGYNNLEYDLGQGKRGSRYVHAEALLCELTGAPAALVVNNNAGAVLLALSALAAGREVVVSRGQLVEIGGSFRIPDVMKAGGALLREVGCTNRTHLRDYEAALSPETALLLKVHTSNYRILGFTSDVSLEELVALGKRNAVPVMEDLGSGSFIDFSAYGIQGEPTVQNAVKTGADVVTFSGDKLLGGPQAGIILGTEAVVSRCKKHPLTRALRVDKTALAALEATLRLYRDERTAIERIPTLRMITLPLEKIEAGAQRLADIIRNADPQGFFDVSLIPGSSRVGGGSLPEQNLPTLLVAVSSPRLGASKIEERLRAGNPPVIGRIEENRFLLDVRTLQDNEFDTVGEAFRRSAH